MGALGILTTVWRFLAGPVGRWVVAALAVVALLAGVHHNGFKEGRETEQAAQAARLERARKDVVRREAKAIEITDTTRAELGRERVRIQTRTVTLIKEVPVYVTPAADGRCVIPVGFVRLHDAAASETRFPATAGGPLDAPAGIDLSAVAAVVTENYGTAYEWRAEAMTWRSWYAKQKAAWDAP